MSEKQMKAAIFDLDGTLTNTERLYVEAWTNLISSFGFEYDPTFPNAVCGSNGEKMRKIIEAHYPGIDARKFMAKTSKYVFDKEEEGIPLMEGALEILSVLKEKGYRLAIASSNLHHIIERNLRLAGISEYFDVLAGGDEVAHSKPAPDIFLKAAERLGCSAEECYAFEDGINGLKSALSAGCRTIMMIDLTPPDQIVAPQCFGVFQNFHEVLQKIDF